MSKVPQILYYAMDTVQLMRMEYNNNYFAQCFHSIVTRLFTYNDIFWKSSSAISPCEFIWRL